VNNKLKHLLPTGRFLAACLMHIDTQCRTLTLWNGGMPDVFITKVDGGAIEQRISSKYLPLGVLSAVDLDTSVDVVEIKPGCKIYAYSDGLTEAHNASNELFGEERLEKLICETPSGASVLDKLSEAINDFRQGVPQNDDITLLEFVCDPHQMVQLTDPALTGSHKQATAWDVAFEFKPDTLRAVDPLQLLMMVLSELQGFNAKRENLFTILSELYNNALDHGVLKLDSNMKKTAEGFATYYMERENRLQNLTDGYLKISFRHAPTLAGGRLSIIFEDSGDGFDFETYSRKLESGTDTMGRGIALVHALCTELNFSERGNRVEAVIEW
jgi:anti-sigma regulatory factor (Ser/Thr protein kinase)